MSHPEESVVLNPEQVTIPPGHAWNRIPTIGVVLGVVGLIASAVLGRNDSTQFFFSWLVAFLFFLSLSLGAMYFVLVHYAMQGGWGVVVRRIAESTMAIVPIFVLLFLPLVFGLRELYPWSDPDVVAGDHLLEWKQPFLNVPFFFLRAGAYFVLWTLIGLFYFRASRKQDVTGDPSISLRLRRFSGPAIIALALTQTFASVDWIMSLEPHWYSTIFGVYYFAGSLVSFFALLAIIVVVARRAGLLHNVISEEHLHDVGKLVFTFTAFWAYIAFSQFFLIWYGNIPEETTWFHVRLEGSWKPVSTLLAVGHFIVPFFFFMSRTVKRNGVALVAGAIWVLVMHLVDVYWQVMPVLHEEGMHVGLLDVAAFVCVLGWFMAALGWVCRRQALVPVKDPRLSESLSYENI